MLMKKLHFASVYFYNIYHIVHFKSASCSSVKTVFCDFLRILKSDLTTFFHGGDDTNVPEKNQGLFKNFCCIFQGLLSDCSEYYNGFKT